MHLTEAKEKKRNKSFEVLLRCQERQKQNNDFFYYFFSVNGPSNGKLIRMINACGRDKRRMLERRGKKSVYFQGMLEGWERGTGTGWDGFSQRAPLDIRQKMQWVPKTFRWISNRWLEPFYTDSVIALATVLRPNDNCKGWRGEARKQYLDKSLSSRLMLTKYCAMHCVISSSIGRPPGVSLFVFISTAWVAANLRW